MNRHTRSHRKDAGVTLTELAVYIVLLGIISTIVASVVVQAFQSEQTVSGVTQASSQGQNFSILFRRDMANARSAVVTGGNSVALCTYPTNGAAVRANVVWLYAAGEVTRTVGTGAAVTILEGVAAGGSFTAAGTSGVHFDFTVVPEKGADQVVEGTSSFTVQTGGSTC